MHEPTYRNALAHSWQLVWHHKTTWVLGLLAVFLGQFGLSNFLGMLFTSAVSEESWWPASWGVIRVVSLEDGILFGWLAVLVAALLLLVVVAAVCAEGALIVTAMHWFNTRLVLKFTAAWKKGVEHFWSILAINVLEKLFLGIVLTIVVSVLPYLSTARLGGLIATIAIVSAALLLALTISTVAVFALGYVMTERRGVTHATRQAWSLFHNHLLVSLELSVVLLVFNFLVVFILSVGSLVVLVPTIILIVTAGLTQFMPLITVGIVLYFFLLIAVAALVGGVFNAFTTSAWMYLFMKMYHEGMVSRVFHFFGKLLRKK